MLSILSRPLNRFKVLVVGAMFIALTAIYTVPLAIGFFELVDPGRDAAYVVTLFTIGAIGAIEIVRVFHVRFVRRSMLAHDAFAPEAGSEGAPQGR